HGETSNRLHAVDDLRALRGERGSERQRVHTQTEARCGGDRRDHDTEVTTNDSAECNPHAAVSTRGRPDTSGPEYGVGPTMPTRSQRSAAVSLTRTGRVLAWSHPEEAGL